MKKVTFILALGVSLILIACGSESTTNQTTDSSAAQVDTSAITATDSTTAQITSDSTYKEVK